MQGSLDKGLENGGFGRLLGNEAVFFVFFRHYWHLRDLILLPTPSVFRCHQLSTSLC